MRQEVRMYCPDCGASHMKWTGREYRCGVCEKRREIKEVVYSGSDREVKNQ